MEKKFDSIYIKELADEISKCSLISYDDFPNYYLFLSQVVEYLNDTFTDEEFTNNIVQNYIKSEVITKPEDGKKRGYTKTHLIQLVLLGHMRPLLMTEEIKKVFKLAFNDINDSNDDILSWEETYKTFMQIQKESLDVSSVQDLNHEEKFKEIVEKFNLKDKDEERIGIFLLVLSLVSKASAIKKLVQKIVNEYNVD
jgi:hypothetical protein